MKMCTVLHETCEQYVARRLSEGWRVAGRYKHLVFLSPPDGSFLRPVDLRNDVETLNPNAAGDAAELLQYPDSGEHWDKLADDSDDTFVYTADYDRTPRLDLCNIQNSGVGLGAITSVKIYARCRCALAPWVASLRIACKINGEIHYGNPTMQTTSWAWYSKEWMTNPKTEEAWTWIEINALQAGVALRDGWYNDDYCVRTYCSKVYVEVNYTAVTTAYKDISTRFRLEVLGYKDTATRFLLTVGVQAYQDAATRFILNILNYQDIVARFKLLPPASYQDVSTRFFLYQPSWKALQILGDIAALEAKIAGLKREPKAHFEI